MSSRPLRVVSVSLGSDRRDKTVEVEILGHHVRIERRGTNGDLRRAAALVAELDGQVDAFGLGGTDLYLQSGSRRYLVRDAARIVAAARRTPILDGGGLKHTLEREAVRRIDKPGIVPLAGKRALLVCGVDRFAMAEALDERCRHLVCGDLMFGLGLPIPIHGVAMLGFLARLALPIVVRLPFSWLYPTGESQETIRPRWGRAYAAADVIAGDFHFIRRSLPPPADPPPLAGKVVLTNTTTEEDIELLRARGLSTLVTTTPRYGGRSFGTNVLEAVFVAIEGAGGPLPPDRLLQLLVETGWEPTVERLDSPRETAAP